MSKNANIEPQIHNIYLYMGQFGFSSVNPRFGTKKLKSQKSTQNFFWTKTKNTCPIILIETQTNEI
jgi:hypothetical protein